MGTVTKQFEHLRTKGLKSLVALIDPDEDAARIEQVVDFALVQGIKTFFVGGSLITAGNTEKCIEILRRIGVEQIVLFPGNEIQVVKGADAILFLSLISGRNAEFLIGKQVTSAPKIKELGLETLPTGYMLIESGKLTSANYMSSTLPIPSDKPEIAAVTAMAGEMLGLKHFYLDAGSGAQTPVSKEMIQAVRRSVSGTVITGGGIRSAEAAYNAWSAGSDVVVIGNGIFENPNTIKEMTDMCAQFNTQKITV